MLSNTIDDLFVMAPWKKEKAPLSTVAGWVMLGKEYHHLWLKNLSKNVVLATHKVVVKMTWDNGDESENADSFIDKHETNSDDCSSDDNE